MKNIFKKNQIIITALAIMLVIAGYLSFMEKDSDKAMDVGVNGAQDYDTYIDTANDDLDESDLVSIENGNMPDILDGMMDISDEDILTVTDGGEILPIEGTEVVSSDVEETVVEGTEGQEIETSAPGEAIIVSSTQIGKNYFASAKLEREQLRAVSQDRFLTIVNNTNLSEDAKTDAVAGLLKLTELSQLENDVERLLEAKGYMDAVVSIETENIDVIVNAVNLTEQDIAIIEDIVMRKAEAKASDIFITPVVLGE